MCKKCAEKKFDFNISRAELVYLFSATGALIASSNGDVGRALEELSYMGRFQNFINPEELCNRIVEALNESDPHNEREIEEGAPDLGDSGFVKGQEIDRTLN